MRILVVLNTHVDARSVSGVMKLFALTARGWIEQGHQVDFLLAKAAFPALRQLVPGAGLISSDSVFDLTRFVEKTWLYFLPYAWRMASAHFTRLTGKYDVVYASGHFIVEAYPARVLARRAGALFAVKVPHVLTAQSNRRGAFDRLFIAAERWSVRLIHQHAGAISCLTAPVAVDYHELERRVGLPKSDLAVIGCGLDWAALASMPERPKHYDVVFLARMHEKKGVFELPLVWQKVLERHPKARLLAVGEGPHRRRTQELFAELGLQETVTFTGAIDESEKNRLVLESKVGLSLSYEEGWGLSITEFMAAGLPVVTYDLPVFAGVFGDHLLSVRPGDVSQAASQISELLSNPALCQNRGLAGKEYISRYDYRNVARQEIELLSGKMSRHA